MRGPLLRRQIWGMPVVLAVISAIGLLSALLGDGVWGIVSWVALAMPVMISVWCAWH